MAENTLHRRTEKQGVSAGNGQKVTVAAPTALKVRETQDAGPATGVKAAQGIVFPRCEATPRNRHNTVRGNGNVGLTVSKQGAICRRPRKDTATDAAGKARTRNSDGT